MSVRLYTVQARYLVMAVFPPRCYLGIDMKLNHIRDVIAVAERGSLRSAARHLGIAQPAITRSIRELEHELGAALFVRHVNGVVLTPMGEAFLRRATAIQLELERTKDEIQQLKGIKTGTVAVGLSTAVHVALLPRVLRPFSGSFPEVQLKIVEGLFPAMEAELYDGSIDFYVGPLAEDSASSEFAVEKLFDNHRMVVGRRNHPLARARSLAELAGAKWVTTSVTVSSDAELGPVFARFKLPAPGIAVKAQTGLSMLIIAAYSDFLTMVPRQWLDFAKTTKLLQQIDVREELVGPSICIVRRARLPLTPVAEQLSDLFRRAATHHMAAPRL
jgi:LysR family transcriptional regulator, regulator of abg operon